MYECVCHWYGDQVKLCVCVCVLGSPIHQSLNKTDEGENTLGQYKS